MIASLRHTSEVFWFTILPQLCRRPTIAPDISGSEHLIISSYGKDTAVHTVQKLNRTIIWLLVENALTSTVITMPVITLFWQIDLGMSWGRIVALQLIFMVVMIATNLPTGYLADRFSPRKAVIIGDGIAALGWLIYAVSPSFAGAVIAEIVLGLGMATSSDADKTLLKWTCEAIMSKRPPLSVLQGKETPAQATNRLYDHYQGMQQLAVLAIGIPSMIIGGWLGLAGARTAMLLSGICAVAGAAIACLVIEPGSLRNLGNGSVTNEPAAQGTTLRQRLGDTQRFTVAAWIDMWSIVRFAFRQPRKLAWSLMAQSIGSEYTHASVWLLSPMLIALGASTTLLGASWAINLGLGFIGNLLPITPGIRAWYKRSLPHQRFGVGALGAIVAMAAFAIQLNAITIMLYGLMDLVRGWFGRVSNPMVLADTPSSMRSTIGSLGSTLTRLLYFAPMILIWRTSTSSFEVAYFWQLVLFVPLTLAAYYGLRTTHRR